MPAQGDPRVGVDQAVNPVANPGLAAFLAAVVGRHRRRHVSPPRNRGE